MKSDSALSDARQKAGEGRVFALTIAGGFLFLSIVGFWRGADRLMVVSLAIAVASLFAALLIPGRLTPISKAWMKVGEAIGHVTTPVLLAVIYYLIFTPIGVVRRSLAPQRSAKDSNWHRRPPLPPPSRMERQF
jgi:saxitoxin biosynthesis operon SxtJ-like protein